MSDKKLEEQFKQESRDYAEKERNLKKLYDMRNYLEIQIDGNKYLAIEYNIVESIDYGELKIDPELLSQEQKDALELMAKRRKFIEEETTKINDQIKSAEVDLENRAEKLKKLQAELIQK